MRCGLLGRKLGHSYSPQIHRFLGEYSYDLFEKEPEEVEAFLKNGAFDGINVTIPYKKTVIPFCAELSPIAERMGAVNTIVRRPDGSLVGHNTDYSGFLTMLRATGLQVSGKKVLVLGSGGASNTAVAVLQDEGAQVVVISRSGENNYENLSLHGDASVIVNATPVGMYPKNGVAPVDLEGFPKLEGVLDLIYNPARTKLLQEAAKKGLIAADGLKMLVAQAEESARWFTGNFSLESKTEEIYSSLKRQMENIILIGMPGCGKSTIGRLLGQLTGREFLDADSYLAERAGKSIPEIFSQGREAAFRRLETETLEQLGKLSGKIIATGGGCVTRVENLPLLQQNGRIFWIQRDPDLLPTDGRPLSQTGKLQQMYQIRKPMYEKFADAVVSNSGTQEDAAEKIQQLWEEIL